MRKTFNKKPKTPWAVYQRKLKDQPLRTQIDEVQFRLDKVRVHGILLVEEARLCLELNALHEKLEDDIKKLNKITEAYERFESIVKELYPEEF